jgi:hypothetical protein
VLLFSRFGRFTFTSDEAGERLQSGTITALKGHYNFVAKISRPQRNMDESGGKLAPIQGLCDFVHWFYHRAATLD